MLKGFIFSLDATATLYIFLIFAAIILSYLNLHYKNENSLDKIILYNRLSDIYLYSKYNKYDLPFIYKQYNLIKDDCVNHNLFLHYRTYSYPNVLSGYPNRWFQAGKKNKHILIENKGQICFERW